MSWMWWRWRYNFIAQTSRKSSLSGASAGCFRAGVLRALAVALDRRVFASLSDAGDGRGLRHVGSGQRGYGRRQVTSLHGHAAR